MTIATRSRAEPETVPTVTPDHRQIYREHHVFVWRCLHRLGVADATIEDALQEVFLTAFRRMATFEHRASLRGWLGGIARRVAFRHRRTHARDERRRSAWAVIATDAIEPDEYLRYRTAEAFLQSFVDGLDRAKRDVFVLCELEGVPGQDAAVALGVNPNTAYARLRVVRALFDQACRRAESRAQALDAARVHRAHAAIAPSDGAARRSFGIVMAKLAASESIGGPVSLAVVSKLLALTAPTQAAIVALAIVGTSVAAARFAADPRDESAAPVVGMDEPVTPATIATPPPPAEVPAVTKQLGNAMPDVAAKQTRVPHSSARAPVDPLEAELRLLESANDAAKRGRWDDAREVAQRYLDAFPRGELRDEARALIERAITARTPRRAP